LFSLNVSDSARALIRYCTQRYKSSGTQSIGNHMGSHVIVVFVFSQANCPSKKAIKRNPTFGTESLRNPDVLLITLWPNLTVDIIPCLTSGNGRNVYKLGAEGSRHVHLTFAVGW